MLLSLIWVSDVYLNQSVSFNVEDTGDVVNTDLYSNCTIVQMFIFCIRGLVSYSCDKHLVQYCVALQ